MAERFPGRPIDEWYPGMGRSRPLLVDAGAIVAYGRSDVDDDKSGLHDRIRIGVQSVDGYHSVDPGKLTTAPLFAMQAAERVVGVRRDSVTAHGNAATPRVVACLPAWRAAAFIGRTLDALAAQTYPNLDVLISDDASTDDTAAICERFAAEHARFRLVRQSATSGWIGNVNALLRAANGDYLLFAFHDDPSSRPTSRLRRPRLESESAAVMAFSDIRLIARQRGRRASTRDTRIWRASRDRIERARRLAAQGRARGGSRTAACSARRRDAHRRAAAAPRRGVLRRLAVAAAHEFSAGRVRARS